MNRPILLTMIFTIALLLPGYSQKVPKSYLNANVGVGLLPTFVKDGSKAEILPLMLNADYKMENNLTLGLSFGHSVSRADEVEMRDGSMAQWVHHFTAIGVRTGASTRLIAKRWRFYGGLFLGCSMSELEMLKGEEKKVLQEMGMAYTNTKMFYTAYVGTRYSITPHFGAFTEVSLGVSLLSIGASVSVW